MKSISENFTKIIKGIALGSVVFISFNSCSSREDSPTGTTKDTGTVLKFNITGIADGGSVTNVASASVGSNIASVPAESTFAVKEHEISTGEFNVLTSAEAKTNSNIQKIASLKSDNINAIAASPLSTTSKFRILIYNAGSTNIVDQVANVVATPGTNPSISVVGGQSYDWYVVSTNDATPPTVANNGSIVRSSLVNKDLLYAKSATPIVPQAGQNDLGIVLHRRTAKVNVQLDARGVFGVIGSATALEVGSWNGATFTSAIQAGDYNVFTDQYSGLSAVPAITATQMVNADGATGNVGATKVATFYSANPTSIAINNLSVRLNTFNITLDDTTTRTFATNTIVPYANATALPIAIGSEYNVDARLIESGLSVGGAVWARTNLQYLETATGDKYRFLPTNDIAIDQALNLLNLVQLGNGISNRITNLYWNWNSITPTAAAGTGDPCGQVYPQGKWKTPTQVQLNSLGVEGNAAQPLFLQAPLLGYSLFAARWAPPSPVNSAFPTDSQQLFMPMYGYRTVNGANILDTPSVLLPLVSASVGSNYWSSDSGIAQVRNLTTVLTIISLDTKFSTVARPTNTGMSVRCVRS
ncbi:MAG: hypothetical protein LBE39_07010 [Flavobacteriaceae bacterium]|jgi:hypothetical protein|nr:hypothetical protein [Flavobacteriaceae bacterium]